MKIIMVLIIGIFLVMSVNAKKTDGIIVFKNDSVAYVTFDIPITFFLREVYFVKIQNKIKYFNSANEKTRLKPGQVKEIRFEYKNEDIRMLSCKDLRFSDPVFIRIIIEGNLNLYEWYYIDEKSMRQTYYIQKGDEELFYPALFLDNKGFENEMKNYLSDCPALAEKFDGKTFNYSGMFDTNPIRFSIIEIVEEYNKCK